MNWDLIQLVWVVYCCVVWVTVAIVVCKTNGLQLVFDDWWIHLLIIALSPFLFPFIVIGLTLFMLLRLKEGLHERPTRKVR